MQDARYLYAWPNRASALDVLDNNTPYNCTITSPATSTAAQVDTCINEFTVDFVAPDVSCQPSGICNDPFKIPSTGVPIPLPGDLILGYDDNRDPGGGIQVRLVFDKVLDDSIETVTMDPSKLPGQTNTYMVEAGLVELDDGTGAPVDSAIYYDNGGSYQYSADLELVPLGPAIVIKPKTYLDPHTTYTVKIGKPGDLKDREGNAATALGGGALATTYKFTTEDLHSAADAADVVGFGPYDYPAGYGLTTITPDEVIQTTFFGNIAGDSSTVTVNSGPSGIKPIAFSERFNDPTMCPTATSGDPSGFLLDIVNSDTGDLTTALPVDWPNGDYDLTVTTPAADGMGAPATQEITFTVGVPCTSDDDCTAFFATYGQSVTGTCGTTTAGFCDDATTDANNSGSHITPAQCTL
ncbi:MAG TPA: hypothetical protein VGL86_31915 [Polyangia bacterium]